MLLKSWRAARQPPTRFHFLGLPECCSSLDALRDVAPDSQDADEPSLVSWRVAENSPTR